MIAKLTSFIKEVRSEMAQVSWPTRSDLLGSTKVVIVSTALLTLSIYFFDIVFAQVMSWVIRG